MSGDIITGIFTIAGIIVGSALAAERSKARDLFTQVVKAISAMEVEKASFKERRDSLRPNLLKLGGAALTTYAAYLEGNWVKGAATSVRDLMAWDSAEGARFVDRFQAAATEIGPALVQLSLMSDGLQSAASPVGDAVGAVMKARKPADAKAADEQLQKTIAGLRRAVHAFGTRRWWQRAVDPASPTAAEKQGA
jgi:hypothetical protein